MSVNVGIGYSQKTIVKAALTDAFEQAYSSLGSREPNFMIVFASSTSYDQKELLAEMSAQTKAIYIGCSTAGEITSTGGSLDKSLAIMAFSSDKVKFVVGTGGSIKEDPRKAGAELARNIREQTSEAIKAMIMLPDGLAGNGADIVRGVLDIFGETFPVIGGSAGDDFLFKQTFQYYNGQILSGSVVGVGLCGDFNFSIGVRHGWIPIGISRLATKSKGSVLYELDNKPAISIYEDQFGKDKKLIDKDEPFARLAITYPLGIVAPGKDGFLIRDPITVDQDGAITCAAEIPEGSEVFLMIGSRDEAITAAQDAARQALQSLGGRKPKGALLFNCIARKKLLMSRRHEEIESIRQILGMDLPLAGFYTYGEQAPLGGQVLTCSFHNETDVIFLLAD